MKEIIKIVCVLTFTCVICALLLSFTFSIAKEKIALNAKKSIEEAIFLITPQTKRIEELKLKDTIIYKLFDEKNNFIGCAFLVEGDGYQGKIKMLAIADADIKNLEGIEIIESVETPGLGAKIKESFFKEQFKHLNISSMIECIKGDAAKDNQIKAITSATISSRAVVSILNKRIEELNKNFKETRNQ